MRYIVSILAAVLVMASPLSFGDMGVPMVPHTPAPDGRTGEMLMGIALFLVFCVALTIAVALIEIWVSRAMGLKLTPEAVVVANFVTYILGLALMIITELFSWNYKDAVWEGYGHLGLALLCLCSAIVEYFLILNYRQNSAESLNAESGITVIDLVSKKAFMIFLVANIASYAFLYTVKVLVDTLF